MFPPQQNRNTRLVSVHMGLLNCYSRETVREEAVQPVGC